MGSKFLFYFGLGLSFFLVHCSSSDNTGQLPTISSITTATGLAEGPVTGGTSVTIQGTNFADDAVVSFGDQLASDVSVSNFETLTATTQPVFRSGAVPVTITTGGQIVRKDSGFLYTQMIAFTSNRDGDFEIFIMETDGKGARPLTINALRDPQDPTTLITDELPKFSPDGRQILFDSNRTEDFEIFIMERDGTNQTNLTENIATDLAPAFSPDGAHIVFMSNRLNVPPNFELFLMDRDGSNLQQLTQNQANNRNPRFSPDGSQILFVSDQDGDFELFLIDRDGGNLIQLTQNQVDDRNPTFSPDGSKILFVSDQDGDFELFLMDSNGNNSQQLTANNTEEFNPVFLPILSNEKRIIFTSDRTGNLEIFEMHCDGSAEQFIIACDESTTTNLTLHAAQDADPHSSP